MSALPHALRWIAFDLDDTLHYFRRASGRAAEATFLEVERQLGIDAGRLAEAYREILQVAQRHHFVSAKTSREYRSERFAALLEVFGVDPEPQLDRLLDIYDTTLGESLQLRPGAAASLRAAKRAGLSVMVISEGPHDAQQTTIERLGIATMVDLLVTSAAEGTAKSDGLFERALARAGCEPEELLYVGDSLDRDIRPTSILGIASVYVGEEDLPDGCAALRIDLSALAQLLDRPAASGSAQWVRFGDAGTAFGYR